MRRIDILGVGVDAIDQQSLLAAILHDGTERRGALYSYVNAHALNLARENRQFRELLNRSDVVYCDGEGVRLAAKVLRDGLPRRIVLTYFVWELCKACEEAGLSIYLLGGSAEVVEAAVRNLREKFRSLAITGWHHGYFNKTNQENEAVVTLINKAKPHLLFVGFGMPLQEIWIEENRRRLGVGAFLPCGSMIEYAAGVKRVAPLFLAARGMEWVFRLMQEPRRLWKRYLIGNPAFLAAVLRQRLRKGGV